ncbi:MAG: CYTH domain-containing protein [Methylococcales bacterium]|nr:CYTH domain-containing protein [Methylococcales bacterium]
MALEIEHKFLLKDASWRASVTRSARFRQGYLETSGKASVRVRTDGEQAWLNVKSATLGNQRHEYEYPIPLADAEAMLDTLCRWPLVEKIRHWVNYDGKVWEIDEFLNANQGLIVAEIELDHVDEAFSRPPWLGEEVTQDVRYYNNNLVQQPYGSW